MGYEDFVYFILSEEDKSAEPSLEYWYCFPFIIPLFFFFPVRCHQSSSYAVANMRMVHC